MATQAKLVTFEWSEVASGPCVITPSVSEQGFTTEELPVGNVPAGSRFFVHFGASAPAADSKDYHGIPSGVVYNGQDNCYMRMEKPDATHWVAVTEYNPFPATPV